MLLVKILTLCRNIRRQELLGPERKSIERGGYYLNRATGLSLGEILNKHFTMRAMHAETAQGPLHA